MNPLSPSILVGFAALRSNLLRTTLSALGVIIGVGAMVSVLSFSDGVEREVRTQVDKDGRLQSLGISPRTEDVVDGQSIARTNALAFTLADARGLEREIAALGTVYFGSSGSSLITVATPSGSASRGVSVSATLANGGERRHVVMEGGRFFSNTEVESGAKVAAISRTVADVIAGRTTPSTSLIGKTIELQGTDFEIVGVWNAGKTRSPAADSTLAVFVPVSVASIAMAPSTRSRSPSFTLVASTLENLPEMERRTKAWLARRYGQWQNQVTIASYAEESSKVRDNMVIFKILMGAITGISLVVGGIGIINVLLAQSRKERGRSAYEKLRAHAIAICSRSFSLNQSPSPALAVCSALYSA